MDQVLETHALTALDLAASAYPASGDPSLWRPYTITESGETLYVGFPGTCSWRAEDWQADAAFNTAAVGSTHFPVEPVLLA